MKLTRYKLKWLSRLMLGMVLFMQGVVTSYACITPAAGAIQAFTVQGYSVQTIADQSVSSSQTPEATLPPCHQKNNSSDNANACLQHCTQSDQVSGTQVVPLMLPVAWGSTLVIVDEVQRSQPLFYPEYIQLSSGPLLSIKFCSFLI